MIGPFAPSALPPVLSSGGVPSSGLWSPGIPSAGEVAHAASRTANSVGFTLRFRASDVPRQLRGTSLAVRVSRKPPPRAMRIMRASRIDSLLLRGARVATAAAAIAEVAEEAGDHREDAT